MPSEDEYRYIDSRLGRPISRHPPMNLEECRKHDLPIHWISKGDGRGEHWTVVTYKRGYYLAR